MICDLTVVCVLLISGFFSASYVDASITNCGFFINLGVNQTGEIISPNYPSDYPNSTRCIWRLQAPAGYHVVLTATTMAGERRVGECRDFLLFRDGSRDAGILDQFCDTGFSVTSQARWLWVMFQTDSINSNTGFLATYTTVLATTDISGVLSPVRTCKWFEYTCANRECVPQSYRCDGANDCGCSAGCDEEGCTLTSLDRGGIIGIGISSGIVLFLILFCAVTILDRKHHNMFFRKMNEKEAASRRPSRANSTLSSTMGHSSSLGWGSRANSTLQDWMSRANSTVE